MGKVRKKKKKKIKHHLIGKPPKQDRNHHTPPQLSHDIEQAKAPNPENSNWAKETWPQRRQKPICKRCGVNNTTEGIEKKTKGPKEGNKGEYNCIEKSLL